MNCWLGCIAILVCTIIFCEFIGDYLVTQRCNWPELNQIEKDSEPLRAMIIADTHLLGPHRGHWLDKLYREWHMKGAFQAASVLLKPDVVFVLGDLFDEGDMVSDKQFQLYVLRFWHLFQLPAGVPLISIVGNHDVGFHYKMHPYFTGRFEAYLNNTGVHLYTLNRVHFVLINSMAMEDDDCFFCSKAKTSLNELRDRFRCMQQPHLHGCRGKREMPYSQPILLQHFPTYRSSDSDCIEHDSPEIEQYQERYHVLSKESTDLLGKLLNPRLAFGGHSHHYCHHKNHLGIDEYTVASFSWRNKVNPSFMLAVFTPDAYAVLKCDMLAQHIVYVTYFIAMLTCLALVCWQLYQHRKNHDKLLAKTKAA